MKRLVTDEEVLRHLHSSQPIIDVRAPVEFAAGSIPGSTNLPLLDDSQRHEIGIVYKNEGNERAVALGYQLISGDTHRTRIEAWSNFLNSNDSAAVICFRGGQRSQLVQHELARLGFDVPLIEGGFKRVRRLLSRELSRFCNDETSAHEWRVLAGFTGSGKTELLRASASCGLSFLDLEKAARHRGSVFGPWPGGQATPVTFENELGLEASRLSVRENPVVWLEDESRSIGRLVLPPDLFQILSRAKVWVLERPRADRARRLTDEYLRENYGFSDGVVADASRLETCRLDIGRAILKIEKRLGGAECRTLFGMTDVASRIFAQNGSFSAHWPWVERLLEKYYDPLYESHLDRVSDRVIGRGPEEEFRSLAML